MPPPILAAKPTAIKVFFFVMTPLEDAAVAAIIGIIIATTAVLLKKADKIAVTTTTVTIKTFSFVPTILIIVEPIFCATPVSNKASPNTIEPITIMVTSLEKPANTLEKGIIPNTPIISRAG